MADATTADPTNAVEVAALLTEAAEAGTAVEAMRIVFSTTVGAQFAELLVQQLGYREPPTMSGADEVARLQGEVEKLQEEAAAKDAAMEKVKRDQEWLEEGRSLAYEQLLSEMGVPSPMSGSGEMITFPLLVEQLKPSMIWLLRQT